MSKKIIALLSVCTILFVCAFAACEKKPELYKDAEEFEFVTDESGEKVLAEDGRILVYQTEENGEHVTDDAGEEVTIIKQFEPIVEEEVIEDYGFKLAIPEGWKTSDEGNVFENTLKNQKVQIRIVQKLYDEYYASTEAFYSELFANGAEGSLTEDASLVEGAEKAFRLIVNTGKEKYISVVCLNSGNLYNFTLTAENGKAEFEDLDVFLKNIEFKPYTYYPELTSESEKEVTKTESEATTKESAKTEKTTAE